jgi:hypothetical protein
VVIYRSSSSARRCKTRRCYLCGPAAHTLTRRARPTR